MSERKQLNIDEFICQFEAAIKHALLLKRIQYVLISICGITLFGALYFKFTGQFTGLIIPSGLAAMISGFGTWVVGQKLIPLVEKIEMVKRSIDNTDASRNKKQENSKGKIPLSIGFANFSGIDLTLILDEDKRVLSPLFSSTIVAGDAEIPKTVILFVYAHLNDNGTISGTNYSGIRQIVQLTNAAIIVVASPNSPSSIKKALQLPGPKTANIIFTLERKGEKFSAFFYELFVKMSIGKNMLEAWAELAPQTPQGSSDAPQTLLIAEGGKIAFPNT